MKAILELKRGNSPTKRISVRQDIVIGRGTECSLRLPSSQVSRKHCSLTFKDDVVYVSDLGSSNGTWLNGVKLPPNQAFEVGSKMKLALGPINFVIHVVQEDPSKTNSSTDQSGPEITGLEPIAAVPADVAKPDQAAKPNVSSTVNPLDADPTEQQDSHSQQDPTEQNDSIGRLQPITEKSADQVQKAQAAADSRSDEGILQFDESMLVNNASSFELPTIDALSSEKEIDEIQILETFDIMELEDIPIVDEGHVIKDVKAPGDVEVMDDVQVLDDIEVLDDVQMLDDVEVLDDIEVLDDDRNN